jgi:hypothetical protein
MAQATQSTVYGLMVAQQEATITNCSMHGGYIMIDQNTRDDERDEAGVDIRDESSEDTSEATFTGPAILSGEYTTDTNTYGGPTRGGALDRASLQDTNDESGEMEIPAGNFENWTDESGVSTPEMDDQNVPGEIDIENLDEDALSETDIPKDALLDPLEP